MGRHSRGATETAAFESQSAPEVVEDADARPYGAGALVEVIAEPDDAAATSARLLIAAVVGFRARADAVGTDAAGGQWAELTWVDQPGGMVLSADRVRVVAEEDRTEVDEAVRRYVAGPTVPDAPGELRRDELLALTAGEPVEVLLATATGGARIDPRRGWVPAIVERRAVSLLGDIDLWVVVDYPAGVYGRDGRTSHTEHFTAGGRNVRRPGAAEAALEGAAAAAAETIDDQGAAEVPAEGESMGQTETPATAAGWRQHAGPVGALLDLVDEYGDARAGIISDDAGAAARDQLAAVLRDPEALRAIADRVAQLQAGHVTEIEHDGFGHFSWWCALGDADQSGIEVGEGAYRAATAHGPLAATSPFARRPVIVHDGRGDNEHGVPRRKLGGSLHFEPYDGGVWTLESHASTGEIDEEDLVGAQAWAARVLARGLEYHGGDGVTVARWEHHRDDYGDWWEPVTR